MVTKSITCVVDGCNNNSVKRGYCTKHYKRFMRHGDPLGGGVFRGRLDPKEKCSGDGCSKTVAVAHVGLCNSCYLRKCRNGSLLRSRKKKGFALRWLCRLSRGHYGCVLFPFAVSLPNGEQHKSARIVCEMFNGPPKPNQGALHLCGNGHLGCVNPDHVIWGDQTENGRHKIIHNKIGKGHEVCLIITQNQEKSG